jgi:hypothetical protein
MEQHSGVAPGAAEDAGFTAVEERKGPIVLSATTREQAVERARSIGTDPGKSTREKAGLSAYAYRFNARVFSFVGRQTRTIGIFRRGTGLRALKEVSGPACKKGSWFSVWPRGYVCSSDGVTITDKIPDGALSSRLPDTEEALPYRYARVITPGAPLLYRLPTLQEHERIEASRKSGQAWPEVVAKRMIGDYFVALDSEEEALGMAFWKTVRGRYVYKEDLKVRDLPSLMGVELKEEEELPLAFVHLDRAQVYRDTPGGLAFVGYAEKHAYIHVRRHIDMAGKTFLSSGEFALAREDVRYIEKLPRPERVPAGVNWIHIDLTEQTLVAYEKERPVYVTLVSSGKPGYDTPRGTFQIRKKYITNTMSGRDPKEGVYDVGEVPWVMYYFKSYAIHGAYWHNTFGGTRSHGCTNISPVDAKWLFHWTTPKLPDHWHGVLHAAGTYVHLTR